MSYDPQATRRRLWLYYLALPGAAALAWLVPQWSLLTDLRLWYLLPLWVVLAHALCGVSYVITARKLQRFWGLLRNSIYVYGHMRSWLHLQAALLVAVLEEFLFRYALMGLLTQWTGSALLAVGGSSLAFGLAHVPIHLRRNTGTLATTLRLVDLTLFGLALGALVWITRSLWPALVIHALRNYILRCLLVSRKEYARYHAERIAAKVTAGLAEEMAQRAAARQKRAAAADDS